MVYFESCIVVTALLVVFESKMFIYSTFPPSRVLMSMVRLLNCREELGTNVLTSSWF